MYEWTLCISTLTLMKILARRLMSLFSTCPGYIQICSLLLYNVNMCVCTCLIWSSKPSPANHCSFRFSCWIMHENRKTRENIFTILFFSRYFDEFICIRCEWFRIFAPTGIWKRTPQNTSFISTSQFNSKLNFRHQAAICKLPLNILEDWTIVVAYTKHPSMS